ncbi:hypothetical protein NQ318_022461 [Aromia moschata]|uniref:Uncharacterized protein n=1 Tax=Aromia moschata TaxID=1265417 RepID=A0AAV8Z7Q3_9CUCU|nr:hypothetical protein NQ318_022461 [Aromia moschata]
MNSVDFLLANKDITYEIRTEIKRLGRPIPDSIISKTTRVYDRFKWLCGCPKRNKLFCFICLVMGGNRSAWTQDGIFDSMKRKRKKAANPIKLINLTEKESKINSNE